MKIVLAILLSISILPSLSQAENLSEIEPSGYISVFLVPSAASEESRMAHVEITGDAAQLLWNLLKVEPSHCSFNNSDIKKQGLLTCIKLERAGEIVYECKMRVGEKGQPLEMPTACGEPDAAIHIGN